MARDTGRVLRVIAEMPAGQQATASLVAATYQMDEGFVINAVRELAAAGYVTILDVGDCPVVQGVTPLGRRWVATHHASVVHDFWGV
ncbi:hypothetical protein AB0I28_06745 [Phytomonospora sp. NPDC050363]|uniref:hypothetical protein n=1 Tax=Phytomonospora sp. NPDC050363 TaxID=3155642 RepID=UPI0033C981F8